MPVWKNEQFNLINAFPYNVFSLANFIDKFGSRLAGTQSLESAIDYMVNLLKEQGLEKVHTEDVEIVHWARGEEFAKLLRPRVKDLPMLGLGGSVATPPENVIAFAVVVKSFEELHSLPDTTVTGKIVVFAEEYEDYHSTVKYRTTGASEAAKKGAIAALIKTIAPFSIATPHTGEQYYQDNIKKIPVAAITIEDADELLRMYKTGYDIVIQLRMPATTEAKISRNTIAELTGASLENKIVVVSGHLDSWDVGVGAMDDGGGAFISWLAPVILKNLGLRPKRTLRAILWTAEEQGLIGAEAYEKAHRQDNDNLNFVMESDAGTFSPLGIAYSGSKTGKCMVAEILKLFRSINTTHLALDDEPGPDITFFTKRGVPGGGLLNANDKYFWYHHSAGDTMNVLDPDVLDRCTAFWAAFSYVISDLSFDIPRE